MTITPRSLFNIILKIFGLFFLKEIITELLDTVYSILQYSRFSDDSFPISFSIFSLLVLGLYTFLAIQLLFKSNQVIDMLKLDKGFVENEFSFDQPQENRIALTTTEILNIALIVIGGYLLVDQIPHFCNQGYLLIQAENAPLVESQPIVSNLIVSGAKIVIGFLILGERKRIVDIIQSKKREEPEENEESSAP